MKKILYLILFTFSFIRSYSQCDSSFSPIKLTSSLLEEVEFELCYRDSLDFLIVKEKYLLSEPVQETFVGSADLGNYLLTARQVVLFTTENSKFQLPLSDEEKFNDVATGEIIVYSYYAVTRNKIKFILLGSIETIEIVKEDAIQTFELSHLEAVQFYKMAYRYFRWKKWKN
jgi:hypothetical protein